MILGWVLNSLAGSLSGALMTADPAQFFSAAASQLGNPLWHTAVVVIVCLVLMLGVTAGIEKASRVLMPLFFVLFIALAVWVATLSGAGEGYRFLLVPDWSKLLEPYTWVMAMGQAFFSLSITGSGMIVYGAYLGKGRTSPRPRSAPPCSTPWPPCCPPWPLCPPCSPTAWMCAPARR